MKINFKREQKKKFGFLLKENNWIIMEVMWVCALHVFLSLVSYLSVESEDIFRNKYNFQLTSISLNVLSVLIQKEKYG